MSLRLDASLSLRLPARAFLGSLSKLPPRLERLEGDWIRCRSFCICGKEPPPQAQRVAVRKVRDDRAHAVRILAVVDAP